MSPALPNGLQPGLVETAAGKVHYISAGNGPPLFLIHGGHGSWMHWYANVLPLAQQHTVFALDMPGFGQSFDPAADSSLADIASSVWQAIAVLRSTLQRSARTLPVDLAAFSFGTAVATQIALQEPQQVQSLVLINPPGLGQVSQQVRAIQACAAEAARNNGLRAGLAITLTQLMLCQPLRADRHALDLLEYCVRHTRFISRPLSRGTRLVPMLKQLRVPAHVMLGENDPHQRHELTQRRLQLEQTLGAASVSIVDNAAHWLQYDQPECFNARALSLFAAARQQS